jgi:dihydroorotase
MGIVVKNGRVLDPGTGLDKRLDILLEDGRIAALGETFDTAGHTVVDAAGLCVAPGLIDLHVHLRDPGLTYKEDIATGTAAAAAGGFTAVACMPNTKPVCDNLDTLRYIQDTAARTASCRVLPICAVTVEQKGETMTDFDALYAAGAAAFSDDGVPVMRAAIMRAALQKAKDLHTVVIAHEEDGEMVGNRACNEGKISELLGIPGRPAIAEDIMVARDVMLAADTGAHVHIAHVSTAGAVEIIRKAKAAGVHVTAETCPQYFWFTEDLLPEKGTLARVNPPLRTERDRQAVLAAVADGTLDCIVTDHAPHSAAEKAKPLTEAPSGMIGLETSLAASLTALYHGGHMPLLRVLQRMTASPAAVLGYDGGTLRVGGPADLVLFDPDEEWTVDPDQFRSKARNSLFAGMTLRGRVHTTICGGEITYSTEKNT